MKTRSPQYLKGKKILSVDAKACNLWVLTLDNGKKVVLDTEPKVAGIVGPCLYDHEEP